MSRVTAWTDASSYAHFVFNAFDQDRNGSISFEVISLVFVIANLPYNTVAKTNKIRTCRLNACIHKLSVDCLTANKLRRMSLCSLLGRPHYGFRPSACLSLCMSVCHSVADSEGSG